MRPAEAQDRPAADRRALAEWLAGDRAAPLVLARSEGFDVDRVTMPSLAARLRLVGRHLLVRVGGALPGCRLKIRFFRLAGARIGRNVCIAPGAELDPLFPQLIELADDACLGLGCRLLAHEYTATEFRVGRVRVGRGAVVGGYSTVRSGVTIGEKATVGFNSYVNRDVAPGDTVGGVPARSLKRREEPGEAAKNPGAPA